MTIQAENETITNEQDPQNPAAEGQEADLVVQEVLHPDEARLTEVLKAQKAEDEATAAADAKAKEQIEAAKNAEAAKVEAEDPSKKPTPQVPVEALIATRKKGQETETKLSVADAKLALLADLSDTLTPEQIRKIARGEQTIEEATTENEADPYDLLDAKELELEKKREDGEIDGVEYRKGMQLVAKERRQVDRQLASQTTVVEQNQQVKQTITAASRKIAEDFPIVSKITSGQLEACKPLAVQNTYAGMEQQFGKGVEYNDLNPEHRLFFQWNLASVADRNYGDGKGPVSQQKPNGQPLLPGKPNAKEVIATSPAAKAAAVNAPALARGKTPPDLSQFSFSADTELGQLERTLEHGNTEDFEAAFKKNPALRKQLEGRT